ncbi:unnamed protein product, partial [marine sediment metagenome]
VRPHQSVIVLDSPPTKYTIIPVTAKQEATDVL